MRTSSLSTRNPLVGAATTPTDLQTAGIVPVLGLILDGLRDIRELLSGLRKEWYTIEEVAELTGRTAYTIRRWVKEGRIAATRVSGTGPRGRLLVGRDQLERLIAQGVGGAVPPAVGGSGSVTQHTTVETGDAT
jgi:excisionase family DNA binding protein